jgi:hypothetical protein
MKVKENCLETLFPEFCHKKKYEPENLIENVSVISVIMGLI